MRSSFSSFSSIAVMNLYRAAYSRSDFAADCLTLSLCCSENTNFSFKILFLASFSLSFLILASSLVLEVSSPPFASATLSLYQRRTMALLAELSTEDMELKTLLPENVAENGGFWAEP